MSKCSSVHLLMHVGRGSMQRALYTIGAGTVTSGPTAPGLIPRTHKSTWWLMPDSLASRLESGLSGSSSCSALRTVSYPGGCPAT